VSGEGQGRSVGVLASSSSSLFAIAKRSAPVNPARALDVFDAVSEPCFASMGQSAWVDSRWDAASVGAHRASKY